MIKKPHKVVKMGINFARQAKEVRAERAKNPKIRKKVHGEGVDSRGLTLEERKILVRIKYGGYE